MTDMMSIADHSTLMMAQACDKLARIRAGLEPLPASETYLVLDPLHLDALRKKVDKLSRKACKLGGLPVTLWESPDPTWVPRQRPDGSMAHIRTRRVSVIGDIPDTGDWQYAAVLHHLPSGTILQRAQHADTLGDAVLADYRARGPVCDHCGMRRARNDTYVIRHKVTGEVTQVGSACLEAFCSGNPAAAVYAFDAHKSLTDEMRQYAALDDAVRAEDGMPVLDALRSILGSDDAARDCLSNAERHLVPSLVEERRVSLMRAAGMDVQWTDGIARLTETLHDAAVIVAEGYVSPRHMSHVRVLAQWYRTAAEELARQALLSDPVAQLAALGIAAIPSDPVALATWMLDPVSQAAARALLAKVTGQPSTPPPAQSAPARTGGNGSMGAGFRRGMRLTLSAPTTANDSSGQALVLPAGTQVTVFWHGMGRTRQMTVGVHAAGRGTGRADALWIETRNLP